MTLLPLLMERDGVRGIRIGKTPYFDPFTLTPPDGSNAVKLRDAHPSPEGERISP